jgi:hypothetical protein
MTKLEREKYLLALNDAQRLALLLTIGNVLKHTDLLTRAMFEETLLSYHVIGHERKRR